MDNLGIARIFTDIGDLLEIKSANPFKVRAYRNAADIVGHMAERIADLTDADVRELPGIGKDLTAKIRELIDTDALAFYDELLKEFPPTILDMLRLQGVGPRPWRCCTKNWASRRSTTSKPPPPRGVCAH